MRTVFALVAMVAVSVKSSDCALAQSFGAPGPRQIRLGVLHPRGATADTFGDSLKGVLADLGPSKSDAGSMITVGYFSGSRAGRSFTTAPILLTRSGQATSPIPGIDGLYSSTGLGAYLTRADGAGSKTLWGGYAAIGLRLPGGLFAETQYHAVSGNVGGFAPSGVAFVVGRRF
ncbi:MAG: hypothetical protein ACKO5K_15480 [Armatimonadota bacterium]